MKRQILVPIFLGSLLAFAAPVMSADKAAENAMPTSKILQNLQTKGFSIVSELEFKDGNYKATVINAEGRAGNIVYNPQTGDIMKESENKPGLTALDIAKAVENAGYYNIEKIDTQWLHNKYNVTALDKDGEKTNLVVDALTGTITKE